MSAGTMERVVPTSRTADIEHELNTARACIAGLKEQLRDRDRRINAAAGIVRRFDATEVDRVAMLLVEVRETLIGQDARPHVPRRTPPVRLAAA